MPTRLDSEDPEMVANLRAMSPASLRTVAKTIASLAVERAGIRDPRMDAGLAALRNQGWDDAQIRRASSNSRRNSTKWPGIFRTKSTKELLPKMNMPAPSCEPELHLHLILP